MGRAVSRRARSAAAASPDRKRSRLCCGVPERRRVSGQRSLPDASQWSVGDQRGVTSLAKNQPRDPAGGRGCEGECRRPTNPRAPVHSCSFRRIVAEPGWQGVAAFEGAADRRRIIAAHDAAVEAGRAFLERDLEQADACVSVDRAQARAGRSREGATALGPADFSWSAVYRLAEVERGGNARPASGRRRGEHYREERRPPRNGLSRGGNACQRWIGGGCVVPPAGRLFSTCIALFWSGARALTRGRSAAL